MSEVSVNRPDVGKGSSWLTAAGVSALAVLAARHLIKRRDQPLVKLRDKVVLVTGGSRGLGLAIAREFGRQGARVALCARDDEELRKACEKLAAEGIEAVSFPADITDAANIEPLVSSVISRLGSLDVLVNNAGRISVGPFDSFTHADFEEAMNLMFWAPVNLTLAALPHMKGRSGHIINITSVGGRVSVPHLLPYSCAKFAFVGFSTGLSAEAHSKNIRVLTVVPGLMRTGSYLNAEFQGDAKHEFAWFGLLGNLPGLSVAAEYAAERIRESFESGHKMCTISLPAKILIACEALAPEATRTAFGLMTDYFLPSSSTKQTQRGKVLNPALNALFQGLTALGRRAAHQWNE
ncbi:MAG: SDR family oxidoreductase [Acidobacteriaceae bacterium]|nr:SDR family oxidoreductase [Acidobacteriaceae bacterium]MBV9502491.1 SDR family oxidoreductase [Acidobacteriaceae bacterium]